MAGTTTPPRGFYRGHCAAYDTTFGCFRHLPNDVPAQLLLLAEDASAFICVDGAIAKGAIAEQEQRDLFYL
jgi:hypothetical protein